MTGRLVLHRAEIHERCKDDPAPPRLALDHPEWPELLRLCVLCRELQKAHDAFGTVPYLGCRKTGQVLGISHETANQYFRMLVSMRYIQIVEKGRFILKGEDEAKAVATRFKYIGD